MSETSLSQTLRIAPFRRLWFGLMVFNIGHLVQLVASSWTILDLTGSPFWVSLMVGAPTLPLLVLSLPAGAAADLFDRRLIVVGSAAIMTAGAAGMALLSHFGLVTPARLVLLGLTIGVGVAFLNPAMQAIVPALVPTSLVPGAVSLNSATSGVANAVGPAIGGVLVATASPASAFWVAAAGYLAMVVVMLRTHPVAGVREKSRMRSAIATGVRYLRFSPGFFSLLLLGSLFGFTSAALRSMLPNLISDVLDGGPTTYGLILGAFGIGAVMGGLTRGQAARLLRARMVPLSIIATGCAGVVAGVSTTIFLTGLAVLVSGLLWSWILATLVSTFQLLSPDWVRGRTMSAFVLSVFGFVPIGSIAAGQLGNVLGAATSLVIFSTLVVGTGLIALRVDFPVLEDIEPPTVSAAQVLDGSSGRTDQDDLPRLVTNQWLIEDDDADEFLGLLAELRTLRLATGAHGWGAYQSSSDHRYISEIYRVHSWEEHVQQQGRFDTAALETLAAIHAFRAVDATSDVLIALDVRPRSDDKRRPFRGTEH